MTSFAKSISATPIKAEPSRNEFKNAAAPKAEPPARGSEMVARDQPHPAPRPSQEIAGEVDRAASSAARPSSKSAPIQRRAGAFAP